MGSPGCWACKTLKPKLHQIMGEHEDKVVFVSINGEEAPELCQALAVDRLPWFQLYRAGELQSSFTANLSRVRPVPGDRAEDRGPRRSARPLGGARAGHG